MKKKTLLGAIGALAIPGMVVLSCGKDNGESIDEIKTDAINIVAAKNASKGIISNIKPTKTLVNRAIIPTTEKTVYEAAIKAAYEAIDHAKTSDEIKNVFNSNKLLVEKAKEDYENAIKLVLSKKANKDIISDIKPTKTLVNGAIVPTTEKTVYETAIKAAYEAIDHAKTSDEIKNVFNSNKLLVEKAKEDYENAIKLVLTKKANKDIISDIKPTKTLVNGAIVPTTEKTVYETAIKAAHEAIDHAKTSDEIKNVFNSNKLLVEKAKEDYENAIKLVLTKKANKGIISNIKPTKTLVNGAIVPIKEKTAYEAAIKAAYEAIDHAKTSDEIKNVFNSNKLLVEKAKEDYENAIKLVLSKKANKDIISDIKPTKTLVNGAIVPTTEKTVYETAIKAAYKAIDHAKTSDEIKSVFNSNKLLVEKAKEDYENAIKNSNSGFINSRESAEKNMSFNEGTKTLTIEEKVNSIEYDISSIWSDIREIKFSNPENIENIGNNAFQSSKLTTLDLSSLTNLKSIGESAFQSSELTTLDLSGLTNLKSIGDDAFKTSKLTTLDLSSLTNLESIGDYAFQSSKLTTLDLSGLTNLESIGSNAFYWSKLTTLDLSSLTNLKSIGESAFSISKLTTLDLSSLTNLKSIGVKAFVTSKLTTLDLSGLTNLKSIGGDAFQYSELTTLDLSSLTNLESIGSSAFQSSELTTLDLSSLTNLESIGEGAFYSSKLTTLDLSSLTNLESIGENAFYNSDLTTLDLSSLTNLRSIGHSAFHNSDLTTLDLSGLTNLKSIGHWAFNDSELTTLDLSGLTNLKSIGDYAFQSSKLTTLDLSGLTNLKSIGSSAFHNSDLTTLDLSGLTNLEKIKKWAFRGSSKNLKIKVNKELWNKIMGKRTKDDFGFGENIFGTDTSLMTRTDK